MVSLSLIRSCSSWNKKCNVILDLNNILYLKGPAVSFPSHLWLKSIFVIWQLGALLGSDQLKHLENAWLWLACFTLNQSLWIDKLVLTDWLRVINLPDHWALSYELAFQKNYSTKHSLLMRLPYIRKLALNTRACLILWARTTDWLNLPDYWTQLKT